MKIIITVCTYLRPKMLERALNHIRELKAVDDAIIEVLIVDNDKNLSAKNVVETVSKDFPYLLHYKTEEERGLSPVRNKALKSALELGADYIACFDDDDSPDKDWLFALWNFEKEMLSQKEKPVIVTGPAFSKFDKNYPKYITMNFRTKTTKKTGQLRHTAATGNVLIPAEVIKNGVFFDEQYKFMGGEDGEFFQKAQTYGFEIYWCNEAVVYENITEEKANIKRILHRYFYNGFSNVFFELKKMDSPLYRIKISSKAIFNILICALLLPVSLILGRVGFLGVLSSILKSAGKFYALLRKTPLNFYQNTIGN
ncbi:glycosyltransferase [bacterium]|nr:glycosyltransferase [bacterium]